MKATFSLPAEFMAQPAQPKPPAETLAKAGTKISELYEQFRHLRALAAELNNLPASAPIPDNVTIKAVTIDFTVKAKSGPPAPVNYKATVNSVTHVGDLAPLLQKELERVIMEMRQESVVMQSVAATFESSCERALYKNRAEITGGPT